MGGTFVLGDNILDEFTVYDQNDPPMPLSGVTSPAGVSLNLFRQSGASMIAASESVSWAEIGTTGRYTWSFTPLNLGPYTLEIMVTHASANREGARLNFSVLSAGSIYTPTFANCFCSESDIEAVIGESITGTTNPSSLAAATYAEWRAAILKSLTARLGYPVTPTSPGLAGTALEQLLRAANAHGAAVNYCLAQELGRSPNKTERADNFAVIWSEYVGGPKPGFVTETIGLIEKEIRGSLVSLSTDHIRSGDTIAPAQTPATSEPFGGPIGMGSQF